MKILVYGGSTGWIGKQLVQLFKEHLFSDSDSSNSNENLLVCAKERMEEREKIAEEVANVNPTHVVIAAGLTGVPNVDWCEDHKQEVVRTNIIGVLNVIDICSLRNIHVSYFATGCIYSYDDQHQIGSGKGFTEIDPPNFQGSYYSKTKCMVEEVIKDSYINSTLVFRLRMPISDDLHPRSFVTKISKYEKVINIPNSVTVLHDLLPVAVDMIVKKLTGIYNFTNPGTISHNQVLDMYKEYINPNFSYRNFTIEEQNKILKAPRSNNELDVSKLLKLYPTIPYASIALRQLFQRMRENINANK